MTWAFDEREMDSVQELNWGLPVSLVDINDSQLAIAARTDADAEPVLIDLESLLDWLEEHRPDLLGRTAP
jgi:hypothetical protein